MSEQIDIIRDLLSARASSLGWSAYRIAKECDGQPSEDAVKRFLDGRTSLNSAYVSRIASALGWNGRLKFTAPGR